MKQYPPHKLLEEIRATKSYKDMEDLLQKSLEHQWQDLVLSGLINAFYLRYKDYFVNRRGIQIKIRKAADPLNPDDTLANNDIQNTDDFKQEENRTRQRNRLLVGEKILNMGALLLWLNQNVDKNMNGVATYYKLKQELRPYLKNVANKSGQEVLDTMNLEKPLVFRLSKREYVRKIGERVDDLVTNMDETTKKRMVYELSQGIRKGETKAEMVDRLTKRGLELSENRAIRIIDTETHANIEYIRHETAKLNGVQRKKWQTSGFNVCPRCEAIDGIETNIDDDFETEDWSGPYPPVHTSCHCYIEYLVNTSMCANFLKTRTLEERLDTLVQKAQGDTLYVEGDDSDTTSCFNPNAIWAGGESLVGADKEIGNYYDEIKNLPGELRDNHLALVRDKLSDEGFVQLRLSLGLKGKVSRSEA